MREQDAGHFELGKAAPQLLCVESLLFHVAVEQLEVVDEPACGFGRHDANAYKGIERIAVHERQCQLARGFRAVANAQVPLEYVGCSKTACLLARFVQEAGERAQQKRHRRHALLAVDDVELLRALPAFGVG